MKERKRVIAMAVAAALCMGIMAGCSDKSETEEIRTLGKVYEVTLENATGEDITGIALKDSAAGAYSENKLLDGDVFENGGKRRLVYDAADAEAVVSSGEAQCEMRLAFAGGREMALTDVPFDDMNECRICLEDGVAFLAYVSAETEEEVTTKDAELKQKEEAEKKAAEEAKKKAEAAAKKKAEEEAAAQAERRAAEARAQAQRKAAQQKAAAQKKSSRTSNNGGSKPKNADGCIGNDEKLLY